MHIPGWLAPLLLAVAVFCLALPSVSTPPRVSRGWALAALVCSIVAGVLFLVPAVST